MKLAILGGGGFRVPLVYGALLDDADAARPDEVALYDVDAVRLTAIGNVLAQLAGTREEAPAVSTTTDLEKALVGADFVFSAVRVGGLAGRVADERVALDLGVLGQETTGPGGIAFGLRTVPVAVQLARRIAEICPNAWVVNFTNPAGMITEAMQEVLRQRVLGICDSPVGLTRRAARALGLDPARAFPDYVGLNHLGWLQGLYHRGHDVLPTLLESDGALRRVEEARLLGEDWVRAHGVLPNEYVYYYAFNREAVAALRAGAATRGQFLEDQQARFYDRVSRHPESALHEWRRTRQERDSTYMADVRTTTGGGERDTADIESGGYERVAVGVMSALTRDQPQATIVNVRNGFTIPGLPRDAVVEVPCTIDCNGPRPVAIGEPDLARLGLLQQVKAVERLTIRAALAGSATDAVKAFALHPLVGSFETARRLLVGYQRTVPEIAAVLGAD